MRRVLFNTLKIQQSFYHGMILHRKVNRSTDPIFGTYNAIVIDTGMFAYFSEVEIVYVTT